MYNSIVYFGKCHDLKDNCSKCGKTSNIVNRKNELQTSYPFREFIPYMIILCNNEKESDELEKLIHSQYIDHNTINDLKYSGTGTEWFNYDFSYNEIKKLLADNGYWNNILINNELDVYLSEIKRKNYSTNNYIQEMKALKIMHLLLTTHKTEWLLVKITK